MKPLTHKSRSAHFVDGDRLLVCGCAAGPQILERLRRRSGHIPLHRPRSDQKEQREAAKNRLDLLQRKFRDESDRFPRRDVRVRPEQFAHSARRRYRERNLDSHRPEFHRRAGSELLGKQRRQRPPPDLPDQPLPRGNRRAHRQIDSKLRRRWASRHAGRSRSRPRRSSAHQERRSGARV